MGSMSRDPRARQSLRLLRVEVTLAEPDLFYSGGTVILDHGYGFSSSFLHLSEVSVSVGDQLAPGDLIGAIGATGRATGPHLDWRMSWFNQRIDPSVIGTANASSELRAGKGYSSLRWTGRCSRSNKAVYFVFFDGRTNPCSTPSC